jgi:hypothetical protein
MQQAGRAKHTQVVLSHAALQRRQEAELRNLPGSLYASTEFRVAQRREGSIGSSEADAVLRSGSLEPDRLGHGREAALYKDHTAGDVRHLMAKSSALDQYKTQICPTFRMTGTCSKGSQCVYAHGTSNQLPAKAKIAAPSPEQRLLMLHRPWQANTTAPELLVSGLNVSNTSRRWMKPSYTQKIST